METIIKEYSGKNIDHALVEDSGVYVIRLIAKRNGRISYKLVTTDMIKEWKTLKGALLAWDKHKKNLIWK